jgi:hypothetical protein
MEESRTNPYLAHPATATLPDKPKNQKKKISKQLRKFLIKHNLNNVYQLLREYPKPDIDAFDFARKSPEYISYIKRSAKPAPDGTFAKPKRYSARIGRIISGYYDALTTAPRVDVKHSEMWRASACMFQRQLAAKLTLKKTNAVCRHYYVDNYYNESGSLGSSCMRFAECQDAIYFYESNPDAVSLLVLVDKKNAVHGRALLWHDVTDVKTGKKNSYLDRVFVNNDNLELFFEQYACKHGCWSFYNYLDPRPAKMETRRVNITGDVIMPYLDTFCGIRRTGGGIVLNNYSTSFLQSTCCRDFGDLMQDANAAPCEICGVYTNYHHNNYDDGLYCRDHYADAPMHDDEENEF